MRGAKQPTYSAWPVKLRASPSHGSAIRFMPLFEQAHLAERYDIAIMSSKGMSNTATRDLVDSLCDTNLDGGIKLLVLHDFDQAGFRILATLQRDTDRYSFSNTVDVVDLGLRLHDVKAYSLQSEPCPRSRSDHANTFVDLKRNGATEEEADFLAGRPGVSRGQRVELNAFTSKQLLEWVESKLTKHGIGKVVPDAATIETAYRRAIQIRCLNAHLEEINTQVAKQVEDLHLDAKAIGAGVRRLIRKRPSLSWDAAVAQIAARATLPFDGCGAGTTGRRQTGE